MITSILGCIACALGIAPTQKSAETSWIEWTTETDILISSGAFAVEFPEDMPGQVFGAAFPEWVTSREERIVVKTDWEGSGTLAIGTWSDENYDFEMRIQANRSARDITLAWDLDFTNNSSRALTDVTAFNDFGMRGAPNFGDFEMERTYVYDAEGRRQLLRPIFYGDGIDSLIRWYPRAGGIDISLTPGIDDFRSTSDRILSGDTIELESIDKQWILQNISDSPTAYFFNNIDNRCIHASPIIADRLEPGETGTAEGRLVWRRLDVGESWEIY